MVVSVCLLITSMLQKNYKKDIAVVVPVFLSRSSLSRMAQSHLRFLTSGYTVLSMLISTYL